MSKEVGGCGGQRENPWASFDYHLLEDIYKFLPVRAIRPPGRARFPLKLLLHISWGTGQIQFL